MFSGGVFRPEPGVAEVAPNCPTFARVLMPTILSLLPGAVSTLTAVFSGMAPWSAAHAVAQVVLERRVAED